MRGRGNAPPAWNADHGPDQTRNAGAFAHHWETRPRPGATVMLTHPAAADTRALFPASATRRPRRAGKLVWNKPRNALMRRGNGLLLEGRHSAFPGAARRLFFANAASAPDGAREGRMPSLLKALPMSGSQSLFPARRRPGALGGLGTPEARSRAFGRVGGQDASSESIALSCPRREGVLPPSLTRRRARRVVGRLRRWRVGLGRRRRSGLVWLCRRRGGRAFRRGIWVWLG